MYTLPRCNHASKCFLEGAISTIVASYVVLVGNAAFSGSWPLARVSHPRVLRLCFLLALIEKVLRRGTDRARTHHTGMGVFAEKCAPRGNPTRPGSERTLSCQEANASGLNKSGVGNEGGDCLRVVAGHGERRSLNSGGQAKTTSP